MEHLSKTAACKRYGIPTYETRITYSDYFDRVDIFYHSTAIATIWGNGKLKIDNGGWFTNTTRKRINAILMALGMHHFIHQRNWKWYLVDVKEHTEYTLKNETNYNGYHFTAYFDTNTKVLLPQGD